MNSPKVNKQHVATFIALLFHVSGFLGMLTSYKTWFIANTPSNLLIMFGLIVWTHPGKNPAFFTFLFIAFATGMITEIIGVNTGLLFGRYAYGNTLGKGLISVPWLIGINWFTIMYCCGIILSHLQSWFFSRLPVAEAVVSSRSKFFSFIIDGAMLATIFDFLLEPVAVKLGYWRWLPNGDIPLTNYLSWFLISTLMLTVFKLLSFPKRNQFAVHLLIIESLFFMAIRTFV
jgi:putative membrane protein